MGKKLPHQKQAEAKPVKIVLDWKAYFIEFCKVHGEPVEHENKLLFRDGWMYSLTKYEGPEYSPPRDVGELDLLIIQYWIKRRGMIERNLKKMMHELDLLQKQQSDHSLPLQMSTLHREGDKVERGYERVDLAPMQQRIKWMRNDISECEQRLKEIEQYYKKRNPGSER